VPAPIKEEIRGLDHVVVAGGTPTQWGAMTCDEWRHRLQALAKGAVAAGAHWVTLLPHHGEDFSATEREHFLDTLREAGKIETIHTKSGDRYVWHRGASLTVIVDPSADGHKRFAHVVESFRHGIDRADDLSEETLSRALLEPAEQEADLVIVLGPPDELPSSMVWELAYSELVFIDLQWSEVDSTHLELAIDDFNRRHRRFGGLDS